MEGRGLVPRRCDARCLGAVPRFDKLLEVPELVCRQQAVDEIQNVLT